MQYRTSSRENLVEETLDIHESKSCSYGNMQGQKKSTLKIIIVSQFLT